MTTDPTVEVWNKRGEFALVLPPQMTGDAFTRVAIGLLRRDNQLAQAAARNPISLMSALIECARLGLEPGTDEVALVPFKDGKRGTSEIVCIPQWQGLIKRMYNSGQIASVHAECVHSGDRFNYRPDMQRPEHVIDWFGDRGQLIGAYAYAVFKDGSVSKVAMVGPREVAVAKATSRGSQRSNSAWQTNEPEMWRKTAVRRLEDWVPSSSVDRSWQLATVGQPVSFEAMPMLPEQSLAQLAAEPRTVSTAHLLPSEPTPPAVSSDPEPEPAVAELVDTDTGEVLR